jgi:hypothetical protein
MQSIGTFTFGDFQFNAQLSGAGTWPGFLWLLGANCQASNIHSADNIGSCNWPFDTSDSAEIDIAEGKPANLGNNAVGQNICSGAPACGTFTGQATVNSYASGNHTYELIWTSSSVTWKVDGATTNTYSGSNIPQNAMFMIANVALATAVGGSPQAATAKLNWVKVCSTACANGTTGAPASNGVFFDNFPQLTPPSLFFSDLDSGVNSGGENVGGFAGSYVTLYGKNLGVSQGTSTVTWNGLNCLRVLPSTGAYTGWGMAHLWYQELIVQIGSGCTAGTGNFIVTTPTGTSNAVSFTVRAGGHIYFVATTGNDSTGTGSIGAPWLTPKNAFSHMGAGDTTYWEGGVIVSSGGSVSAMDWGASGTAGNPVAMVAYPGATPQPGVQCTGCTNGIAVRCSAGFPSSCQYFTMAGLSIAGNIQAYFDQYSGNNERFVGNSYTCTGSPGQVGCVQISVHTNVKLFGNEISNIVGSARQYHSLYFSTDANHMEAGWNSLHNNNTCRDIVFHSSPLGSGGPTDPTGHQQYDLSVHDNLIHDNKCDGIDFASIDPSQGKVEAYNNVIYNVGNGPDPPDGTGSYSGIYFADACEAGNVGSGVAEVYNNTFYNVGGQTSIGFDSAITKYGNGPGAACGGGNSAITINVRNNIIQQTNANQAYLAQAIAGGLSQIHGSNNVWFGNGTGPTAGAGTFTSNINSNPGFISTSTPDFHLVVVSSPANAAGVAVTAGNTYNSYPPWQGNVATDHDGLVRPAPPAIGAYEFSAGVASTLAPPTNLHVVPQVQPAFGLWFLF